MDTGAKIKQLRESLDMTQEELGKLLGVKKAAINKYETGTVVNLKRSTIENLCNIFNVTPQYLLSDSDLSPSSSPALAPELTEQDEKLIATFRRLNDSQQAKFLAYLDGLLDAGEVAKGKVNSLAEDAEREVDKIVAQELAAAKKSKMSMK